MVRLKVDLIAGNEPDRDGGLYLQHFDFRSEAGTYTHRKAKAKAFHSLDDALAYWQTVSPIKPTLPGGFPNRPLARLPVAMVIDRD